MPGTLPLRPTTQHHPGPRPLTGPAIPHQTGPQNALPPSLARPPAGHAPVGCLGSNGLPVLRTAPFYLGHAAVHSKTQAPGRSDANKKSPHGLGPRCRARVRPTRMNKWH